MKNVILLIVLLPFVPGCASLSTRKTSLAELSKTQQNCYALADTNAKWVASGAGLAFLAGGAVAAGASSGVSLLVGALGASVVSYSNSKHSVLINVA